MGLGVIPTTKPRRPLKPGDSVEAAHENEIKTRCALVVTV